LLAGDQAVVAQFTDRLAAEQGNAVEIERPSEQGRGAAEVIEQAKRFLGLAALLTVIVAGVAVLLTVRHYAERQITGVAVMRAMGATRRQVLQLFVGKLLWLGLFAGAVGAALVISAFVIAGLDGRSPMMLGDAPMISWIIGSLGGLIWLAAWPRR